MAATTQRIRILSYFLMEVDDGVLSAIDDYDASVYEELLAVRLRTSLREQGYYISFSTIYRNIRGFRDIGIIKY